MSSILRIDAAVSTTVLSLEGAGTHASHVEEVGPGSLESNLGQIVQEAIDAASKDLRRSAEELTNKLLRGSGAMDACAGDVPEPQEDGENPMQPGATKPMNKKAGTGYKAETGAVSSGVQVQNDQGRAAPMSASIDEAKDKNDEDLMTPWSVLASKIGHCRGRPQRQRQRHKDLA